jgi:hypothetical protein
MLEPERCVDAELPLVSPAAKAIGADASAIPHSAAAIGVRLSFIAYSLRFGSIEAGAKLLRLLPGSCNAYSRLAQGKVPRLSRRISSVT